MGRFWAIFFMFWSVAAVAFWAVAPAMGLSFPGSGEAVSTIGQRIDHLYYVILAIVTFVFVGTQVAIGYVLWRGATEPKTKPALFVHGNNRLEIIWTVIPGILLLFIAIYQMDVWASFRMKDSFPGETVAIAEVTARQFEWRIRYPAAGKTLQPVAQADDLYTVNDLRVPQGVPVLIRLRSDDVQHSFFLPALRIKQDAVPGLVIPIWFDVTKAGVFDLVCAELCGWGHYKMKAQLVATSQAEFDQWKVSLARTQSDDGLPRNQAAQVSSTATGSLVQRDGPIADEPMALQVAE